MTDEAQSPIDALAERISDVIEGAPLDTAATALTANLASVITGYGPKRQEAQQSVVRLLERRVEQLVEAGHVCEMMKAH